MKWIFKVYKQYLDFNGRARRREYWIFAIFSTAVLLTLKWLDNQLGLKPLAFDDGVLTLVFSFFSFLPTLAVLVRRLHDTGRSGWWALLLLTIIGVIPLLYFLLQDSESKKNQYGLNPKKKFS